MKLQAEIGDDKKHEIEIKREDRTAFVNIDGREYELEVSEPEPGVFLFKHEGRVYEASVTAPKTNGGSMHVRIGSSEIDVKIIDPKRLRSAGAGSEHDHGTVEIKTAMPGKVVRVLVEAGAEVEKGDGVIVVEAMKMQNELKSPKAGVVKDIRAAEGTTVGAGDVLATIE
jgi:biotin carboxyl carrier protein